jgi:hypothetical protein
MSVMTDYVVFYSVCSFFNLYVCMTSRLPNAGGRAYAGLSLFELRLRSRRSFLRIHASLSLPDFAFRILLSPMELRWTKTRRGRLFLKSITRHGCDDVVVHLPVTTLIHQVVSLLQSRVCPLDGIQTMRRNSPWLKLQALLSWSLGAQNPPRKSENYPSRIAKTTPTSPTRRLTNFHFSFLSFSKAPRGLTGGTKEPIPSPKKELHHEGIIFLDCS